MLNRKEYNQNYYQAHKEYAKEQGRLRYQKNKEHILQTNTIYLQTHKEQHNIAVAKQHQRWKDLMEDLKINGCAICGYDKCNTALSFHHVNTEDKKFTIGRSHTINNKLFDELNKCILLCSNCHKEIHHKGYQK